MLPASYLLYDGDSKLEKLCECWLFTKNDPNAAADLFDKTNEGLDFSDESTDSESYENDFSTTDEEDDKDADADGNPEEMLS